MKSRTLPRPKTARRLAAVLGAAAISITLLPSNAMGDTDPRIGLAPGWDDPGQAASSIELLEHVQKAGAFQGAPNSSAPYNSDMAFIDDHVIVGSYNGFQVYDVSDASSPQLTGSFICPGGQGDLSVHGDLLFMSVEESRGRIDCGTSNPTPAERFRGIRMFDISDLSNPVHLGGVQTCRGSHTHTLVTDPSDASHVYLYNNGTAGVRSATELAGCTNTPSNNNPDSFMDADGNPILTSRFMVEVIKVPVAHPTDAEVVREARLMKNHETGNQHGLWAGGNHGDGTQSTSATDACHDITAYPEIGLAAGACEGNGLLIDISDPSDPQRIDEVMDANFAYWHSATFNNDGTKVIFTDEWGGGSGARCRDTDRETWGANAIFDIVDGKMQLASYYKLPAPQTAQENCVAHNGSLIPVPGRDIMVQAWYQGGVTVFDFTDSANPQELAFFDRGPLSATNLVLGGFWSAYWYNGNIFGSEIARGFDSMALTPGAVLSDNEIEAASEVSWGAMNPQGQVSYVHAPSYAVANSYVDQAERSGSLSAAAIAQVRGHLDTAQKLQDKGKANPQAIKSQLNNAIRKAGTADAAVTQALKDLLGTIG